MAAGQECLAPQITVHSHGIGWRRRLEESRTMRRKTAFNESHFWENVRMFVFVVAGLVGLWYMMTNVISW